MNFAGTNFILAVLLLWATATAAAPTNLGDSITLSTAGGTLPVAFTPTSPTNVVLGPEFVVCVDGDAGCATTGLKLTIDVSDNAVEFLVLGATTQTGSFVLTLGDLDWILPPATIFDVIPPDPGCCNEGVFGLQAFSSDSITFLGQSNIDARVAVGARGQSFSFQIILEEQAVPEPGILALLGMGLAGIVVTRRRRSAR